MFDPRIPNITHKEKEAVINSRHLAELLDKSHKAVFNAIKSVVKKDAALSIHFKPATYALIGSSVRVTSFDVTARGVCKLSYEWPTHSRRMDDALVCCVETLAGGAHYEVDEASTLIY